MPQDTEQYLVWFPEWAEVADDGVLIRAYDAEQAARRRVEISHSEDPFDELTAMVRGPFGEVTAWLVTAEPTVEFYSRSIEPTPSQPE